MAKFLRPRRGTQGVTADQNILLKSGEMFLEIPDDTALFGRSPGRIIIGDGANRYQSLQYATTSTEVFQPFITDPSLYQPIFNNSTCAQDNWAYSISTASIESIGNGKGLITLPVIVENVKKSLVHHEDSLHNHELRITAMDGSISGLATSVSNLISTVATLRSDLESTVTVLKNDINGLTTTVTATSLSVSNLESSVASVAADVRINQNNISYLRTTASELISSVSDLDTRLNTSVSNLSTVIFSVGEALNKVASTVDDLNFACATTFANHERRITNLEAGGGGGGGDISGLISSCSTTFSRIASSVSTLDTNINNVSSTVSSLKSSVTGLNSTASDHERRIGVLEAGGGGGGGGDISNLISSCTTTFSRIASSVSTLNTNINNVSSSVSLLKSSVSALNTSVSIMDSTLTSHGTSINNVASSVSNLSSSVSSLKSSVSGVAQIANSNTSMINHNFSLIQNILSGLVNPASFGTITSQTQARSFLNTVKAGTTDFPGTLKLGDYIVTNINSGVTCRGSAPASTVSTTKWYVVGMNMGKYAYSSNASDTLTLMSDPFLYDDAIMTSGAASSDIYNTIFFNYAQSVLVSALNGIFGNTLKSSNVSHASTMDNNLASMVGAGRTGASTDKSTTNQTVRIPSEINLFGTNTLSSSMFDTIYNNRQLPLFKLVDYYSFPFTNYSSQLDIVLENFAYTTGSGVNIYFAGARASTGSTSNPKGGVNAIKVSDAPTGAYRFHAIIDIGL